MELNTDIEAICNAPGIRTTMLELSTTCAGTDYLTNFDCLIRIMINFGFLECCSNPLNQCIPVMPALSDSFLDTVKTRDVPK